MGLFIACFLFCQLFDETFALVIRIVQLGKSIRQFTTNDKKLETIDNIRVLIVLARQGRHFCRILGNKRRLPEFRLGHRIENFHQQLPVTGPLIKFQTELIGIRQQLIRSVNISLADIAIFKDSITHCQALPGPAQINIALAILELQTADNLLCHMTNQIFGKIHQVFVSCIRLIELHHGEFGVMLNRDPFVSEVTVDLENSLKAANDQAFKVEFWSDAQEKIHLQGIVMGGKRLGCCPAGDRLHHRRFNFKIIARHHVVTDQGDDSATFAENVTNILIDDQIEITLAIAGFHIG